MCTLKSQRTIARFGALLFVVLLFVVLLAIMTPLVSAASSLDAAPDIGPAGLLTTIGLLGLGTVISLRAKDQAGNKRMLTVDTEKPAEAADTIDQYAELKAEEVASPLRETITTLTASLKSAKDILVGEIIRIRMLTAPKGEGGEPDFDATTETAYLEGLPVERLRMEFDRLPKRDALTVEGTTTSDAPADTDVYAGLRQ